MDRPFEILEHTADVGFRAWGGTPAELFENAAAALVSFAEPAGRRDLERTVELTAEDRESLLVAWLSEVLYLLDAGVMTPGWFQVEEAGAERLRARIGGAAGPGQWRLIVKAVTYHQLEVVERNGRWEASVYLDV
jgi:SHS2 domain-containing protein